MLIDVFREEHVDPLGRVYHHTVFHMRCDVCGSEMKKQGSMKNFGLSRFHCCSNGCKKIAYRRDGPIGKLRLATLQERYGTTGVMSIGSVQEKAKNTNRKRHGVDFVQSTDSFKSKRRATVLARYGVDSTLKVDEFREKRRSTMLERYGAENPAQSPQIRSRIRKTCLLRYGTEEPLASPIVRAKIKNTKENGHRVPVEWISKMERLFGALFVERFGDVRSQVRIDKKWFVDFYIVPIQTYVEFDGAYWHGLDRPIDAIRWSGSDRDRQIYAKWLRDRALDDYATKNGIKLVRIVDNEFKMDPARCLDKVANVVS